ncbi:MAG: HAMP domain-containing histidine kinase [Magnetococcus sp. YQC-5]
MGDVKKIGFFCQALNIIPPQETILVLADPDLLYQAWVNVLNNALEAIGEQPGTLKITVGLEAERVEIFLQDSGPGVALEQIPRLFEPFFTTKGQGTGLGLTIASKLVEANGGWLSLVPDRQPGACFVVRLPRARQES